MALALHVNFIPGDVFIFRKAAEEMCLAIPSKIISKEDLMATVEVYGARRRVSLMLLAEEAAVGDYVLVHAGFAIQKVDPQAGRETLDLFDQVIESLEKDNA